MINKLFAPTGSDISELERNNQESVRRLAGECMVILENDGTLPLKNENLKIALYGNGARHMVKGGSGSGDVNTREVIDVETGLDEAGVEIVSKSWLDEYDAKIDRAKKEYMEYIQKKADQEGIPTVGLMLSEQYQAPDVTEIKEDQTALTNTAVYVLARDSGEGSDRHAGKGDYFLTDGEEQAIRYLAGKYEKFLLVLNIGGVIDTSAIRSIKGINTVLLAGQMGNMGGRMIADVLTGQTLPSGKLADTWAVSYDDYPSSGAFGRNNGNLDDEYYTEGIYVGYRYFDTFHITPAYCFGYGLSYTDFSIQVLDVSVEQEKIRLNVEVANTGRQYAGKEVVQVYYSAPDEELEKPYQELAAFAKTRLLVPGEKQALTLCFGIKEMASYDAVESAWILEKGDYVIRVGNSSRNTAAAAVLNLAQTVKTVQLGDILKEQEDVKELSKAGTAPHDCAAPGEIPETAIRLSVSAEDITTESVSYQKERPHYVDQRTDEVLTLQNVKAGKATIEELTAQLTVDEMAFLCVGTERLDVTGGNIVGSSSKQVPGAAGETAGSLWEKRGILPLVMADGPAGLRLQPHFKATPQGELLKGGEVFGLNVEPFPEDTPADAIDYYQYCTAIPIASTLAQSWDMDLLREMGAIVGAEMKKFHVHLWLAPGMNIHRNPLCGRNFEYYSEDPLLTGKCAASCTKGVQQYGGQGVTLKHYVCNNQENNRMFVNAHVKERTLREIYMKGFEIAVKEAAPYALMTSYNLLNGTHTANHTGILAAARDEWGFDGLVMTDWYTSQDTSFMGMVSEVYPWSSSVQCVKAGNDLQMPGARKNVTDLIKGAEDKTEITEADLQFCVRNILKIVLRITEGLCA